MLEYQLKDKHKGPQTVSFGLTPLRIVFMGTPEFAVASLDALITSGYNVVAVVTAPDKPAGRGMKMNESAVKKYAAEKGLKILQPEKLKNPEFLKELESLHADLQVIVAFRMLPELVWSMPRLGSINLHGSLLPQYRGAAPINWAVINGEMETGVTTFRLKHDIDTGNILLQESFPIGENETAGEVHDRMKEIGASLLVKTVKGLTEGSLEERPQEAVGSVQNAIGNPSASSGQLAVGSEQSTVDGKLNAEGSLSTVNRQPSTALKHAPKIFTETCRIDFSKTTDEVHNLIRGLSPFPGAFTELNGKTLKIYRSEKETVPMWGQAGTIRHGEHLTDTKTFLKFACSDGYILVRELQLEGKKRMTVGEFLRGYHFN